MSQEEFEESQRQTNQFLTRVFLLSQVITEYEPICPDLVEDDV